MDEAIANPVTLTERVHHHRVSARSAKRRASWVSGRDSHHDEEIHAPHQGKQGGGNHLLRAWERGEGGRSWPSELQERRRTSKPAESCDWISVQRFDLGH